MKKMALSSILLALVAVMGWAGPSIDVVVPVYDFGSVIEGIAVAHTFVLKNVGDDVLEISGVRSSCGCTTADLATTSIDPGSSVDLDVLVDTAGFSGTISKSITVYSNDPDRPALSLRIMGDLQTAEAHHIPASDAFYLLYLLVDLRAPEAYEAHHVLGAVNIPSEDLVDALVSLPRETFLILYDADGQAAEDAAATLRENGFTFVHTLYGGLDEWVHLYGMKNLFYGETGYPLPERVALSGNRGANQLQVSELNYLFYLYIDVRSADAYANEHIMGSINIPYADLDAWRPLLPTDALIITYDEMGVVGDEAALWLNDHGFGSAKSMLGGLDEWIRQYGVRHLFSTSN